MVGEVAEGQSKDNRNPELEEHEANKGQEEEKENEQEPAKLKLGKKEGSNSVKKQSSTGTQCEPGPIYRLK